ncbi:MAG: pentapeptide repeat-containing protein [Candidatus Hodarchaeales archaeon]|jgi:uncharacterized protein YjbI with pentapeptide repeats
MSAQILTKKELKEAVKHAGTTLLDIKIQYLECSNIDLQKARFIRANFNQVNFCESTLVNTVFVHSTLCKISFTEANLAYADFLRTTIQRADFYGANLYKTTFFKTDLEGGSFIGANLYKTRFRHTNLKGVLLPSPSMVLLADWGKLSNETTLALMRLDAANHPEGEEIFNEWAEGGDCPYTASYSDRMAIFQEDSTLWEPGPPPTVYEAMCMVLSEKCPEWSA